MHKLYILLLLSFFSTISVTKANHLKDSIGVEYVNGKKIILHKIEPKETYYSLGRKYNVAPKDIVSFNENKFLSIGVIIKVPMPGTSKQPQGQAAQHKATETPREHVVKAKENLGMIAEMYGTTIAALKQANGLSGSNLSIGQVLKLPASGVQQSPAIQAPPATAEKTKTGEEAYIEHVVRAKEFLNMLAEKYNTTIEEIKRINKLTSNNLSIGQILKMPAPAGMDNKNVQAVAPVTSSKQQQSEEEGPKHTVLKGETIFSIAQKYDLTAYQLRQANNLDNNNLSVGQKLIIPGSAAPKYVNDATEDNTDSITTIKDPSLKRDASVYGLNKVEEKGTAVWIADPDLDATKMLVLHRTLPVGSIIKVTNPMSNISILAKVVGKFTENETTKDVILVCTKVVAEKLGVLDKRFFCNITYALQEHEQ